MPLHNAGFFANVGMTRRLLLILLVFLGRWASAADRMGAAEPSLNGPTPLPLPTLGGKQFWADELFFHQWRIQRNTLDGHYRLLDERDYRYASGTYPQCAAALEAIKRQRHLPPMRGRAVVVLHGLVRSRCSMESLCRYLRDKGGYQVFNVEYPSTQADVGEHARALRHIIENLHGIEEVNFVGHSMGNIVIRHYLGDLARQDRSKQSANEIAADRRASAKFHRFVMLGPPNNGALLATAFADNLLFKGVAGEAGQQLGRDWPQLEKRLQTPAFEFGIIAGGKGNGTGYNPMLEGDNDGTISVETTKLGGARDFLVTPVLHSFLMDSPKVQQCVLQFLRHGHFTTAAERHPLEQLP